MHASTTLESLEISVFYRISSYTQELLFLFVISFADRVQSSKYGNAKFGLEFSIFFCKFFRNWQQQRVLRRDAKSSDALLALLILETRMKMWNLARSFFGLFPRRRLDPPKAACPRYCRASGQERFQRSLPDGCDGFVRSFRWRVRERQGLWVTWAEKAISPRQLPRRPADSPALPLQQTPSFIQPIKIDGDKICISQKNLID